MKLSSELERLIIEQIRNEFESAYIYFGMAGAMEGASFCGFGKWMRKQAKEEIEHGIKFFDYLISRGAKAELLPISQVMTDYIGPLAVFEKALEHEKKVTAWIHKMYDLAVSQRDYESQNMLNWFISEQVEEEEQTQYFVDRLKLAGGNIGALFSLDREAGKRQD